jgi:hypothetical protein
MNPYRIVTPPTLSGAEHKRPAAAGKRRVVAAKRLFRRSGANAKVALHWES